MSDLALALLLSAVGIDWVAVGGAGNACDPQPSGCHGAVPYVYRISRHEVTNAQYAEFLNAKAASDPRELYGAGQQEITRSGGPGSYAYAPMAGREHVPVVGVSFYDALRFANWMHNGQGSGDTETGAYTLLGGGPIPTNEPLTRNAGAAIFIPTDAEWYKAAYYDTGSASYLHYPAGTSVPTVCSSPGPSANTANCGGAVGDLTGVGSYPGALSPNGTLDQGGNVFEWTDEVPILTNRVIRGGHYGNTPDWLSVTRREYEDPWYENGIIGFRVAAAAPSAEHVTSVRVFDSTATYLEWDVASGGSGAVYDLARGDLSSLSGNASGVSLGPLTCIENDSTDGTSLGHPDNTVPTPGTAFFYVVRPQHGQVPGSWGFGSDGGERAGSGGCSP